MGGWQGLASCTGDGATWYETESGVKWSSNGGDYDPAVVDWETTDTSGDWDPYYLQDLVGKWVKGEAPNHGVMLKLRDETQVDGKRFRYYSDDFAIAPTLAPKLYLVYTDGSKAIAPTTSVAAPAPGALVGGTAVKVDAAATDDRRVEKVELYIDGGPMPVATDMAAAVLLHLGYDGADERGSRADGEGDRRCRKHHDLRRGRP